MSHSLVPRFTLFRVAASAGVLALIIVPAAVLYLGRERTHDPGFDSRVANPLYRTDGPVVLYDEGHLNTHTTDGGYKPLVDLIRSDGYVVRVLREPVSAASLEQVSVLVLPLARGANDSNDTPAYTDIESDAIEAWVRAGGSLLLVTDHWPYGPAVAPLAKRFDVAMGGGLVQDVANHDADRGDSHLVYSDQNGLLRDHPIVRGRSDAERIRRVLTFTGQSLQGPAASVPFLALSDSATERPPGTADVLRDGGDIRVSMEYGAPAKVAGRSQGIAMDVGAGRVVVLGEAGMLRANVERNGMRVGMNVPGYDNRQLALNIMHWLSRAQ